MHQHGHGHGPGFGPGNAQGGNNQLVNEGQSVCICAATNDKLCLDVNQGSTENRANIILFDYTGSNNQIWIRQGNSLICKNSGKALDIEGGQGEGKNVIQFTKNNGPNQNFKIIPANNQGIVYITSPSGLALTVKGNNIKKREKIIVSRFSGSLNQLWVLRYV